MRGFLLHHKSCGSCKYSGFLCDAKPVGAGLPAMQTAWSGRLSAPMPSRASPLPQRGCAGLADLAAKQAGRSAASRCSAFDLPALPGGREEVLWSGSTGMDAGRAAMGHGWPVAACPRSRTGAREPERSEGRTMGRGLFGSFLVLQKGTRRKGETTISVRHKCRICAQRIS